MRYIKNTDADYAADFIAQRINKALSDGKNVLWLVPGGSAIKIASEVSRKLISGNGSLSISLTDERYGLPGHKDSNWQQLINFGFDFNIAEQFPVLAGKSVEDTTSEWNNFLSDALAKYDFKIGLFGIGADGHTAGILPGSPALNSSRYADCYDAADFTRVTITPKSIKLLDMAVVYAAGDSKRQALENLEKDLPVNQQPAQALKSIGELVIFNDCKGENI